MNSRIGISSSTSYSKLENQVIEHAFSYVAIWQFGVVYFRLSCQDWKCCVEYYWHNIKKCSKCSIAFVDKLVIFNVYGFLTLFRDKLCFNIGYCIKVTIA